MADSAATIGRSMTEWAVLDTLRAHRYDIADRGSKPDDPAVTTADRRLAWLREAMRNAPIVDDPIQ